MKQTLPFEKDTGIGVFTPWPSVTSCCMVHDAAHQVMHINLVPACRAGKGISLTVTAHVSASACSSTRGASPQAWGESKQHPFPSVSDSHPRSLPLCSPWPRAGSLGCSCSTRRSSSVTTDKLTEKVVCVGDSKLHLSPDCYHRTD